ncbi:hypothetical protein, partial [Pseudomonas poae]|uniref:hypothetical protein n=1 Tax=Pseudomonas poae TaxID=200451 RepID=UPI0034D6E943
NNDIPQLIAPLCKSDNPEIAYRAKRILTSYYNPRPSKEKLYPKITSYNGLLDDTWVKCFEIAFEIHYSYEEGDPPDYKYMMTYS